MQILGFVGSLRKGSYNRMLYNAFVKRLPADFVVNEAQFGDWPLFNEDTESSAPPAVAAVKEKILSADAILIVTPEYNRSIPGGLKNMLDWTSRKPFNWPSKKVYIIGSSDGNRGADMSQYDLRRIMVYFGSNLLGRPEFFLGNVDKKVNNAGELVDEQTLQVLDKSVAAFVDFCKKA